MSKKIFFVVSVCILLLSMVGCGDSSTKYDGTIIISWDNNNSRQEDVIVIERRLEKLGIKKYSVDIISDREIEIGVKNVKDTSVLIKMLMYTEKIAFWECYENPEAYSFLDNLNKKLAARMRSMDSTGVYEMQGDTNLGVENKLMNPLWSYLKLNTQVDDDQRVYLTPGPVVGLALAKDTARIDSMLRIGYDICLPLDMVLLWTLTPTNDSVFSLIALKRYTDRNGPFMDQDMIIEGRIEDDYNGKPSLTIKFDEKGSILFEKMTKKNVGRCIAITMGDKVISYPHVESAITGGLASIGGPDEEILEIVHNGIKMSPYKSRPISIQYHFSVRK